MNISRPNLYDYLKAIAILTMVVDHIGVYFFPEILWLRVIGRFAFPIFLFLVGFNGSYGFRKFLRIWGIVFAIPVGMLVYNNVYSDNYINILLVIAIVRLFLDGLKYIQNKYKIGIWLPIGLLIIFMPFLTITDSILEYGSMGFIFGLIGYILKRYKFDLVPKVLLIGTGIYLHYIYQLSNFVFNYNQSLVLLLLMCILLVLFTIVSHNNFAYNNKYLDKPIMFLSKNSLNLYVFHILLFVVLKIIFYGDLWFLGRILEILGLR